MRRFLLALLALAPTAHAAKPVSSPPSVSIADVTCSESVGSCVLTITKGRAKSYSTISVTTGNGTAIAGSDYTAVSLSVTMGNNVTSKQITVPILNDSVLESTEKFTVSLKAIRNVVIARSPATVTINDDDTATPPPPAPDPAPNPGGLAGETAIPDNFTTSNYLEPAVAEGTSADFVGAFRFTCLAGQLSRTDPIVYPGRVGVSHLHQYVGNTGTNEASTYTSLRTTGGSTCTRNTSESPQRTAYWFPAMLDGHGNAVKPDWMNTYYKQIPSGSSACGAPDATHIGHCTALPNGLKFIMGYNMATGAGGPATSDTSAGSDYWRMGFDCVNKGLGESYTGTKHTIAEIVADGRCPLGAWLRAFITVPSCWDGLNLDTTDHRSHMVYANGAAVVGQLACPTDHPYAIPEIAVQLFYTVDAYFLAGDWRLASDDMMGVPRNLYGKTWHGDYWEAWSPTVKNLWQTNCINGHLSCSAGNLGNLQQVKGMQGENPIAVQAKVPLTSIP